MRPRRAAAAAAGTLAVAAAAAVVAALPAGCAAPKPTVVGEVLQTNGERVPPAAKNAPSAGSLFSNGPKIGAAKMRNKGANPPPKR